MALTSSKPIKSALAALTPAELTAAFNDAFAPVSKTATFTAAATERVIKVDATAGAVVANLPTAVGKSGKDYIIKKIDASVNAVTVDAAGSELIDAATTWVLDDRWDAVWVISDGANWLILAKIFAD